ncbi:MAG TPA: glycoside hydrolase family 3 N-terminal domain-containing protein [Mobilitalea sp.]|nr:glycoside hydrolase family 3 N-terminal domain-containing protein [Mobilitalea sp.]
MNRKYMITLLFFLIIAIFNGCSRSASHQTEPTPSPESTPTNTPTSIPTVTVTTTSTVTPIITQAVTPTALPSVTPVATPYASASSEDLQKINEIIKNMSLEEKVGQLFFVRCRSSQAVTDIKKYHLGGYLLFADDFNNKTKKEVKETIKHYQDTSKIPMLIGVDEEGGTVNRVSKYTAFRKVPFLSPQELFQKGGYDLIISDTKEKADLLLSLGINVNLAPVCDVSTDPKDFIYQRSFGKNAEDTSKYVKTVVSTMNSKGIGSVLKHFPGYGNNVDTHTGISIDNRSYQSFVTSDFLPFQAGIKAGAGCILVSHNIVISMDPDYPASLSSSVHNILREELHFNGVIMTDDLSMDAIKQYTNNQKAAILAINAGNDLLIATDYDVQIPAVIAAVKNNSISKSLIDAAVTRVLLWKLSLRILP